MRTTAEPSLPAPPVRERRVLPVVLVFLVLLGVVFGGYVTAGALSEPAGPPATLFGAVTVHPLSGWRVSEEMHDPPSLRLTRGSATLDVFATSFRGPPEGLIAEYVRRFLEPQADQLSISRAEVVSLDSDLRAARVSYVGTFRGVPVPIEGQVTTVVSESEVGVVFDGWAPSGLLQFALDDIETMIEGAEVA